MTKKRNESKVNVKKNKTRQVQSKNKVPGMPKKKAAEDDKEVDKMEVVAGITSFLEYEGNGSVSWAEME